MANVSFKRGLSTALSNVAVEDGVFYLTTDTNRLYVGQGSKLAELNQSVTTYATWAAMEASAPKQEGQFYYAIQENVLACYLSESNKWQQINPDHNDNDDTYVSSLSVGSADKSETGKLKYTITVGQKTKHQGKAETGHGAEKRHHPLRTADGESETRFDCTPQQPQHPQPPALQYAGH